MLEHRHERGYDVVLLTAEEEGDRVIGFALAHYYPTLQYAYLDYIASDPDRRTLGIGGLPAQGGPGAPGAGHAGCSWTCRPAAWLVKDPAPLAREPTAARSSPEQVEAYTPWW